MTEIHSTAVVSPDARLADDVSIGPCCIVGADVSLGPGVELMSHVVVDGRTSIGEGCRVYPFTTLGLAPQDLKYKGERSELIIGCHNTIREHVTMNPGTTAGGMVTRIGDHCLFMVGTHVAHDCRIGDRVIMSASAKLAGHVLVDDHAIIGGMSAVHQHVRIGSLAIIGGMSGIEQDVIPFGSVAGNRARLMGLNIIGLKRHGFERDDIDALRHAYRLLFADEGTLNERITDAGNRISGSPPVDTLLSFMKGESSRGLCQPGTGNAA